MSEKSHDFKEMMESIKELNDVETLKVVGDDKKEISILSVPNGRQIVEVKKYLDAYRDAPERREGVAKMTQLGSFIEHVIRFKDDDSALFANNDMDNPSLTSVLDYHCQTATGTPRFGRHKTFYSFPLSKEWQHWLNSDGETFSQSDFAAFIEDRIGDVMSPLDGDLETNEKTKELTELLGGDFASPAKMMTLSRGLDVNETSTVKSYTNLSSGEGNIVYENEHHDVDGAPIKVPNMFFIAIPIFVSGDIYRIAVRLRYRVRSGNISWSYNLYRIEHVFEDAFKEACNKAKEETELPLFVGKEEC